MEIQLIDNLKSISGALVVGLACDQKNQADVESLDKQLFFKILIKTDRQYVLSVLKTKKSWTEKSSLILTLPSHPLRWMIFLGLGEKTKWQNRKLSLIIRRIVAICKDNQITDATLALTDFQLPKITVDDCLRQVVVDLLMADFTFTQYKKPPEEGWPEIQNIRIFLSLINQHTKAVLKEGLIIGQETNHCRILANTPGGDMTPTGLARAALAERARAGTKLKVKVLDELAIKKLKMGGVIGVSRGSSERPKFIILEYFGAPKSKKPLVFVGKAVTFDTGGLNLKPESGISEMHLDMSGGAAVIHAISAISQLNLSINVIGLVPAVENMPSGSSYRPGDILRTITGKTIEVLNTDAEGRIILADALGYAQKFKPKLIVDLATLTGAAVIALGQRVSALFATNDSLENLSRKIGEKSGDWVWPLPLWDEYAEEIQGTFGDVANIGKNRYGGAITGAIFLKQFIGDYPWIHLDIAPTMTTIDGQFLAKGASGTGVRFLVELAKSYRHHALK